MKKSEAKEVGQSIFFNIRNKLRFTHEKAYGRGIVRETLLNREPTQRSCWVRVPFRTKEKYRLFIELIHFPKKESPEALKIKLSEPSKPVGRWDLNFFRISHSQ